MSRIALLSLLALALASFGGCGGSSKPSGTTSDTPDASATEDAGATCTGCLPGETCENGSCRCTPGSCSAPAICSGSTFRCENKCANAACATGESCNPGTGVCECGPTTCPNDKFCDASRHCVTMCTSGGCAPGETCAPSTGVCSCSPTSCPSPALCDPSSQRCVNKCATVTCNGGETCDPLTGICACTVTSCAAPAACDPSTKRCVNHCANVTCNPGESCDPIAGTCACTQTSCSATERCNAQKRCEPKCLSVKCVPGESCDAATGACACTSAPNSCPAGQKCDANAKCVSLCTGVTCGAGESCNASTGICECGTGPDTCTAADSSQRCDGTTKRCVLQCAGVLCGTGETCNATNGKCECGATTCPIGQSCNATSKRCEQNAAVCNGVTCARGESCNGTTNACECTVSPNSCPQGSVCDSTSLRCRSATNLCANVTCNPGESCDPASGNCGCTSTSCPQGQTCNAQARCVSTASPCTGVTCNAGETCNAATGVCECTGGSCPQGQTCNAQSRCVTAATLCTGVTCGAGETCDAATGVCACTATSCGPGLSCNATSKHCVTSCGGTACSAGQGCYDPNTGAAGGNTCTCLPDYTDQAGVFHPDTCGPVGMTCAYDFVNGGAAKCRLPQDRESCQPGVGCAAGLDCENVTYPSGQTYPVCVRQCSTSADCPSLLDACVKAGGPQPNLVNHCWYNFCGTNAQGAKDPAQYFTACNSEGTGDGTCLPLPTPDGKGGYTDVGYCYAGGTVALGNACSPAGDRLSAPKNLRCAVNAFCIQTSATAGVCKGLCNGAPSPNPATSCGTGESCVDFSGLDATEAPTTARTGSCSATGACVGVTCANGEFCNPWANACQCDDTSCPAGFACDATLHCVSQRCAGVTCNAGETCNGTTGACECTAGSCPTGQTCNAQKRCAAPSNCGTCALGTACNTTNGRCESKIGQACTQDSQCGTNGQCILAETVPPYQFTRGYCVASCSTGACPSGSSCFTFNSTDANGNPTSSKYCYQSCTADATCRGADDYVCMAITDTTSQKACYASSTNSAGKAVGSACTQDHDCFARGVCYPDTFSDGSAGVTGGYCTRLTCDLDGYCPSGSFCGGSVCYQSCTSSASCRTGYDCQGFGYADKACWETLPLTGTTVGRICDGSQQAACGNAGFCLGTAPKDSQGLTWTKGYCTGSCSDRNACPAGSRCIDFTTASSSTTGANAAWEVCGKTCTVSSDCGGSPMVCDQTTGSPFKGTCVIGCTKNTDCDPLGLYGGFYTCDPTASGGSQRACLPH